MSYIANEYNHATPLSSSNNLLNSKYSVAEAKYFVLSDNKLDGSFYPIDGDVGLWGSSISDANGILPEAFVVTVEEETALNYICIISDADNFPVSFVVNFYDDDTLVYSITEENNTSNEYEVTLTSVVSVTRYEIIISRISVPNNVARLYGVRRLVLVNSSDILNVSDVESTRVLTQHATMRAYDTCTVRVSEKSYNGIRMVHSKDTLNVSLEESTELFNIHSAMKASFRQIFGKVHITYTDPIVEGSALVSASSEAHNSQLQQLLEGTNPTSQRFFTLYDNDLSGRYSVSSIYDHVGWTSSVLSNDDGYFDNNPSVEITFAARPLMYLTMYLDDSHECIVEEFLVTFTFADGRTLTKEFLGNTDTSLVLLDEVLSDVVSVKVEVIKVSKGRYPASILSLPTQSTFVYVGYQNKSDLVSIDLLEELTYEDDIEALGGVSANEVTVVLNNTDKIFNASNVNSPVSSKLLRNRKIVPYLGAEVKPGLVEWYSLGTFWSYKWDVPFDSLTASVVGFDTIGMLANTEFINHQVLQNASLGYLIEYVLLDAKQTLSFLEWVITEELYDVIVPYAWFEKGSHAAALQRISKAYPMHIYCDRQGRICAAPQKLKLDYFYDTWSDSTNVVDKTYSSLNTALPNSISVTVINPVASEDAELVKDSLVFTVDSIHTYTLNFSKPFIDNLSVEIDKDSTVSYTYTVYSWGIVFSFTGSGAVRSITCKGTALDTSNTSIVSRVDNESILLNGAVKREVSSDFIQTSDLASYIIDRIFNLSEDDKYDVEVTYRGDISLTINDPIRLLNGIAPDDRYNIKRHQLTWDGALTGTAHLNT